MNRWHQIAFLAFRASGSGATDLERAEKFAVLPGSAMFCRRYPVSACAALNYRAIFRNADLAISPPSEASSAGNAVDEWHPGKAYEFRYPLSRTGHLSAIHADAAGPVLE